MTAAARVLIAGGAGFIGSRLAVALAGRHTGWRITALDNLVRRGSELNLRLLAGAGVEFVHGDIRSAEDLDAPKLEADTVIDCSAEPSVLAGYAAPARMVQNNLVGTAVLLEHARRCHARFVFLSTSRVYPIAALAALPLREAGERWDLAADAPAPGVSRAGVAEDFTLIGHRSLYGATKLAAEHLVEEYHHACGLPAVVNRCGVVAGPGQMARSDQGVFSLWAAAHVLGRPLAYIGFGGQGRQVRDLIHIDDLVELIDLELQRFAEVDGQVFNVGGGPQRSLSLREATGLCAALTGNRVPLASQPENRPGDIPWFITDARRIEQLLGWRPCRSAEQTLEDIVRWIRDQKEALADVLAC